MFTVRYEWNLQTSFRLNVVLKGSIITLASHIILVLKANCVQGRSWGGRGSAVTV
jgi:hypothetical protein